MSGKAKVLTNFLWRLAERSGAQLVQFIVSIVLARILAPDVYGSIALVTVFTTILNVFVDSGMGNALIQKKDADDLDFSSVFYFNMAICLLLYALMFVTAPFIAEFYHEPPLTPVIRVLSLTLVISGLKNVQQAYVSRTMQFKRFFFATLGGTLGAAVIGISLAKMGYGVWALVGQQLFNTLVDTAVLWVTVKWRPKRMFSIQRLKGLFSFGWKLLVSSLLDTVYNNIRQLIIGKSYTSSDLAYFNRGKQFPYFFITNINTAIDSVLLPTLSREQDDRERVRTMTATVIRVSTYIMAPLMLGLAACGEPLVRIVLTEKWLPCVPFMRIFCIVFIFYPVHTANLNAMKAMGRSDLFLKLEIIKKVVGILILAISMKLGLMALAYSMIVETIGGIFLNAWPNRKLIGYSVTRQILDFLPNILLAAVMSLLVFQLQNTGLSDPALILVQILAGAVIYLGGSFLFRLKSLQYILQTLKLMKKN